MSERVFNLKKNQYLRANLRSNMPEPECYLWHHISRRQLGVKFRRQHGVGPYIVDFYCPEKRLVIELDGDSHYTEKAERRDGERSIYLHNKGLTVIRFTNRQVMDELEAVLNVVLDKVK